MNTDFVNPNRVKSFSPALRGTSYAGYLTSNYHVVMDAAKVRLLTATPRFEDVVKQAQAATVLVLIY